MPENIDTGGGAYVHGNVDAGTFIGHDQIILISGYTGEQLEIVLATLRELFSGGKTALHTDSLHERLRVTSPGAPEITLSAEAARDLFPAAARQADVLAYLTALVVNPRYGRWASQFVPLGGTLTTIERLPGWSDIPPEFTLLEFSGEGAQRQLRRTRLEDITQAIDRYEALALLGEPGSGKTTTLYKLALDAAQTRLTSTEGQIPLFLSLADYRVYESPYKFLEVVWRQHVGQEYLSDHLRKGKLFLLVDALNEMPFEDDRDYRQRVGTWRRFVGDWPGNRMIFTCRSRDYSEPLGLHQVEIEKLDDPRVQDFLNRYLPPDLSATAWSRLEGSSLLELVRNPYYLTMLAYIIHDGTWPTNRARLFDSFAQALLQREQSRNHPDWPGIETMRGALTVLAEHFQSLGEGTRLPRSQILTNIPNQLSTTEGLVVIDPSIVLRMGLSAALLDTELAPDQGEHVRFYHHQLQEYFAALSILMRFKENHDMIKRHCFQPRLVTKMPDHGPLGDFEPLPPPPPTGWEEPTILAAGLHPRPDEFIDAVRAINPALAARCLAQAGIDKDPQMVAAVQSDLLAEMENPQVHLRARIAAGEALGRVGDPRFRAIEVGGQRVLLPPLVKIPAGTFHMGSSRLQIFGLKRRGFSVAQHESPRRKITLPAFWVGKYPVTNAEYACFMAAGGYQQEKFWVTQASRAWLRGESDISDNVTELMRVWKSVREDPDTLRAMKRAGFSARDIAIWQELAQMEADQVQALIQDQYQRRDRTQPAYMKDDQYNNDSQPVVGVNWFEALAYCQWLNERLNDLSSELSGEPPGDRELWGVLASEAYEARLPSEAEWEYAARTTQGYIYPWGNRWDAERANTVEGHVLHPTPVGIYPMGATALGVHDLSGNVWEWTRSLYQPYPYADDDGRNALEADAARVVRGGSWYHDQRRARCASRYRYLPAFFDPNIGFRVVVSLADSDS